MILSILSLPVLLLIYGYFTGFDRPKMIFAGTFYTIFFGGFMIYNFKTGYRKTIKKMVLKSLEGRDFDGDIEYEFNNYGIRTKTESGETKVPWSSIKEIRKYKNYIEFQALGSVLWVDEKISPPINEFITMWEANKTSD